MKNKVLILAFILSLVIGSMAACGDNSGGDSQSGDTKDPDKLVVAMELAYPPFETKDENGKATGISVDFSKAFAGYLGKDVEIVNTSWDGLIPSLETDKSDMVISSMTITDEREKTVDFSDPYASARLALLTNTESNIKDADKDLNGSDKTIAVKTGSTGAIFAEKQYPKAKLTQLSDESACVTEVVQGKADAFIYDQLTIYRNWKENKDTTTPIYIASQEVEKWGVAVKEGNTALRDELNAFIKKYTKEGGWDELTEKYLKEEKKNFDKLGFQWFFDLDEK